MNINKSTDIAQIIIDLIMDLNETHNTGNKTLRSIRIWHKIKDAKDRIKNIIKKTEYNAYDIFNFIEFLKICNGLNLNKNMPKNISYSYFKSQNPSEVSSGTFSVIINYNKVSQLHTTFKPAVYLDKSEIYMEWLISNNESSIVDFKTVAIDSQFYSTKVNILKDRPINPTEPITVTKILEFSSAGILYQAFLMCIENVFKNVEMRYKKK